MKAWIEFRTMWTPVLIQMIFITGSALLLFFGLFEAIEGEAPRDRWIGVGVAVVGPLLLRLYCEWFIVVFKIHEVLEDVLDELTDQEAVDSSV